MTLCSTTLSTSQGSTATFPMMPDTFPVFVMVGGGSVIRNDTAKIRKLKNNKLI